MNTLVLKLEKKFNSLLVDDVFARLQNFFKEKLLEIARADHEEGCVNPVQKFIAATVACSAAAVLKVKFGIDLEQQQTIQE